MSCFSFLVILPTFVPVQSYFSVLYKNIEVFLLVCHCMKNSHKQEQTDCQPRNNSESEKYEVTVKYIT